MSEFERASVCMRVCVCDTTTTKSSHVELFRSRAAFLVNIVLVMAKISEVDLIAILAQQTTLVATMFLAPGKLQATVMYLS